MRRNFTRREILQGAAALGVVYVGGSIFGGCSSPASSEVVLYTSVDQPIAAKAVAAFEKANAGAKVRLVTDTEASKSVGLATRLRAEKENPVCHVWWGNEVFYTIGLAGENLFAPLGLPVVNEIDAKFKDAQDRWAGCGLRARVLAVNDVAGATKGSIFDLLDPRFKGKIALARPLAGSTGGHVSALYALWGEAKTDQFFRDLKANDALLLGGNGAVAEQVGSGNLLVGLTDNDDVFNVQRSGGELWKVVPDQDADGIGTLTIPTTVALVKRDDRPAAATALATFLLSDACERLLIDENFAVYSVRSGAAETAKTMNVRYEDAARLMTSAPKRIADIFDGRV